MTPEIRRAALRAAAKTALVAALGCGTAPKQAPQNTPPAGSGVPIEVVETPLDDEATKARKEAADAIQKATAELAALDPKIAAAVDAVIAAENDADRSAAKAGLDGLRRDKTGLEAQLAEAKVTQRRASHRAAAKACITSLDKLAVAKINDLAATDPLKSRPDIYGAFADPVARALPATQTCCSEEMIAFGSSAKHRWACCSALPSLPADAEPSACTPWGPPCPPEMV